MRKILFIGLFTALLLCFPIIALAQASDSISTGPPGASQSEIELFVDEYVEKYIGNTTAGASIALIKNGEMILNKSYGHANIEDGVLLMNDTVLEWGSATKLLVWASAMQLAQQDQLDLNMDIREYLPENFFKKLQFEMPITMYNLMHHNAGWADVQTDLYAYSQEDVLSLEEGLRKFEPKQIYEPGKTVAYSNFGTAVA